MARARLSTFPRIDQATTVRGTFRVEAFDELLESPFSSVRGVMLRWELLGVERSPGISLLNDGARDLVQVLLPERTLPLEGRSGQLVRVVETRLAAREERANLLLVDSVGRACLLPSEVTIETARLAQSRVSTPVDRLPEDLPHVALAATPRASEYHYRESCLLPDAQVHVEMIIDIEKSPAPPPAGDTRSAAYRRSVENALVVVQVKELEEVEDEVPGVPKTGLSRIARWLRPKRES